MSWDSRPPGRRRDKSIQTRFIGTNPTDKLITPGLPVIGPQWKRMTTERSIFLKTDLVAVFSDLRSEEAHDTKGKPVGIKTLIVGKEDYGQASIH